MVAIKLVFIGIGGLSEVHLDGHPSRVDACVKSRSENLCSQNGPACDFPHTSSLKPEVVMWFSDAILPSTTRSSPEKVKKLGLKN
jgi:hypothetical protein